MFEGRGTDAETWALWAVVVLGAVVVAVPSVLILVETAGWLTGTSPIVAPVEHLLGPICHHLAERTLVIGGPLPVCARCTGLYAGWVAGLPVGGWLAARTRTVSSLRLALVLLGIGLVIAITEVAIERLGLIAASNVARSLIGLPLGLVPSTAARLSTLILAQDLRLRRMQR